MNQSLIKTTFFTGISLIAFAANSILCRFALGKSTIDASSFTAIRLFSGAIVLLIIVSLKKNNNNSMSKGSWFASSMLFLYAITFSFAYTSLDTGTGALILYGAIQITMILLSLFSGARLQVAEWIGMAISFAGFVYLILPGVTSPSLAGFLLMSIAGMAWGIYTLIGRSSKNSLMDTTYNFLRTIPLVIILAIMSFKFSHYSFEGVLLAALSGGIASGIGYTIWYISLGGLSTIQAAVFQLLVPILAVLGGVIFISEVITSRLVTSSIMILGGILIVVLGKYYFSQLRSNKNS